MQVHKQIEDVHDKFQEPLAVVHQFATDIPVIRSTVDEINRRDKKIDDVSYYLYSL